MNVLTIGPERQACYNETGDSIHSDKHCGTLHVLFSIYISCCVNQNHQLIHLDI